MVKNISSVGQRAAISCLRRAASNSRLKSKLVSLLYYIKIPGRDLTKEDLSKLCKGGLTFSKLDSRKKNAVGLLLLMQIFVCIFIHFIVMDGRIFEHVNP